MRALVWIAEDTWEAPVDAAAALLPDHAEITLLHVAPADVEALAAGGRAALLGRRPPPPPGPPLRSISEEAARALLDRAAQRLSRPARTVARRGRVEREVVDAAAGSDLLVLARDGDPRRPGPKSLGPAGRFVVDHAPCGVLVVWADHPSGAETSAAPGYR
jgi:nucleotide-binding universal stress UspA family protein